MLTRILLLLLGGIVIAGAQQPRKSKPEAVNYFRDIEPILNASCVSCHQASLAAGGLRLDAPENMLQGGASGPAVIPKNAQKSLLYKRLLDTTEKRMPPVGMVSAYLKSRLFVQGERPALRSGMLPAESLVLLSLER